MAYIKALIVLAALAAVTSAALIATPGGAVIAKAGDDGSWWPGKYDAAVFAGGPAAIAAPGVLAARTIAAPGLANPWAAASWGNPWNAGVRTALW